MKYHHQRVVFAYLQLFKHIKCHFYFLYDVIHFSKFPSTLKFITMIRVTIGSRSSIGSIIYNQLVKYETLDIFVIMIVHMHRSCDCELTN